MLNVIITTSLWHIWLAQPAAVSLENPSNVLSLAGASVDLADSEIDSDDDFCGGMTWIPGGLKKCTRCSVARYCSRECQAKTWSIHKTACRPDGYILIGFIFSMDLMSIFRCALILASMDTI